jgi:hypothetical protein
MMQYQRTALMDWIDKKKNVQVFSCYGIYLNLQFTQCLNSFKLDLLKRKWQWYITSKIQQTTVA